MTTLRADQLMASFAERTGLTGATAERRYLWTDAFAVCNFIALDQIDRALVVVDHVHHVLGRYRPDDSRRGSISGLRIGKPLPERGEREPVDDRLEWDRDGQYFHYLTKWIHALVQVARATADPKPCMQARELAIAAHEHFVYEARGAKRMYWKMSVDLTRPQVASMGQHDPLDGYITCLELDATARALSAPGPSLETAIADFRGMIDPRALATTDPLGIGGLLFDAYRLTQLDLDRPLSDALLDASHVGLARYVEQPDLRSSAGHRLAFRELGLAIGIAAAHAMNASAFTKFERVQSSINTFWSTPAHRASRTYREHEDINDVMLATSLAPTGFLVLR